MGQKTTKRKANHAYFFLPDTGLFNSALIYKMCKKLCMIWAKLNIIFPEFSLTAELFSTHEQLHISMAMSNLVFIHLVAIFVLGIEGTLEPCLLLPPLFHRLI